MVSPFWSHGRAGDGCEGDRPVSRTMADGCQGLAPAVPNAPLVSVAIYAIPGSMAGVVVCAPAHRGQCPPFGLRPRTCAPYTVSRERPVPTAVCRWLFPACQRRKCGNGRRPGSQSGLMTLKIWQEVLENHLVYWPIAPEKRHAIQIQCHPPPHALSPLILTKIRIQVATSHPASQAILTGYTPGY